MVSVRSYDHHVITLRCSCIIDRPTSRHVYLSLTSRIISARQLFLRPIPALSQHPHPVNRSTTTYENRRFRQQLHSVAARRIRRFVIGLYLIVHDFTFWQGMTRRRIRKGSPQGTCKMRVGQVFSAIFDQYVAIMSKTVHFRNKVIIGR